MVALTSLLVLIIPYYTFGLQMNFLILFGLLMVSGLSGSCVGLLLASIWPDSPATGLYVAPLLLATLPNAVSGIIRPLDQLPNFYRWIIYVSPLAWTVPVATHFELSPVEPAIPAEVEAMSKEQQTVIRKAWENSKTKYLVDRRAEDGSQVWPNLAFAFALVVAMRMGGALILWWKSRSMY